ncbi:MAG: hypothetical protein HY726_14080 [Candidatus Rokubacteria bacterium]|nr:hypothetical protein [Candidatus Rokubacteria bacterium]
MEKDTHELVYRLEISGDLDRHAAEAIRLEIRRLAKRYGVDIHALRVEAAEEDSSA